MNAMPTAAMVVEPAPPAACPSHQPRRSPDCPQCEAYYADYLTWVHENYRDDSGMPPEGSGETGETGGTGGTGDEPPPVSPAPPASPVSTEGVTGDRATPVPPAPPVSPVSPEGFRVRQPKSPTALELEALEGARMLDDLRMWIDKYVRFPSDHCAVAIALWVVHTWAVAAFYVTPRLVLDSPEPGSGKTRVLELLALTCHSAKLTLSTTTAALYRRIDAAAGMPPTVLQDEADAVFGRTNNPQAEDLRALFNAGYKRGATVDRCEGDSKNMKVREFPVFAPVALAGIAGNMPSTITTRSITIHMRRRAPGEKVAPFRERDAAAEVAELRERIGEWAHEHIATLEAARPVMPKGVEDRPAEVWEALLAIADAAGGRWPELARAACEYFVLSSDPGELSRGIRLLSDVRDVFAKNNLDSMFSMDVVAGLTADEESEWSDVFGKPINQRWLARELKKYGVTSKQIKVNKTGAKGYAVTGEDGLKQAWDRYLPTPMRNRGNRGNPAGQTVSDAKPVSLASETAKSSETAKHGPELLESGEVSSVSEVSHRGGFRSIDGGAA